MPTPTIRATTAGDHDAVLGVVRAAFSHGGRDGQEEVDIVRRTWELAAAPDGLDLVAVEGDAAVGHVLAAVGELDGTPTLAVREALLPPARASGCDTPIAIRLTVRRPPEQFADVVAGAQPEQADRERGLYYRLPGKSHVTIDSVTTTKDSWAPFITRR